MGPTIGCVQLSYRSPASNEFYEPEFGWSPKTGRILMARVIFFLFPSAIVDMSAPLSRPLNAPGTSQTILGTQIIPPGPFPLNLDAISTTNA
jgi:hypothetical protein